MAARLRRLRAETFGPKPAEERPVEDVEAPVLRAPEPDVAPPAVAAEEAPAGEDYAVKYAMEMAAHRDTTERLIDEKDRAITRLEDSVAELRAELDRMRMGQLEPDRD